MFSFALLLAANALAGAADTTPIHCRACSEWNAPQAPFRLHGDSWYVGTKGLSAVLVTTPEGLVLIDGGLPQSAAQIASNIESLGFRLSDIRWLLNSHPHWDHAGGLAALQRVTGAAVVSTAAGAAALQLGNAPAEDPQSGFGEKANAFPPIAKVNVLADGASLSVGATTFTMHATPGHTPGGATWTWQSCVGADCRNLVYADSLTAVSSPGFRFSDDPARVTQFRNTIERVGALRCDLIVTVHPDATDLFDRLARRAADAAALFDRQSCRRYAERASSWLDKRLAEEQ